MTYYLEQHPNLKVPQFGWPRNRVSGVIGAHTTESGVIPAGADPGAENTAHYLSIRMNHGSYHSLADWDTRIKLVRPRNAAWADVTNNAHAMSVSGAMNAARWRNLTPERAAGIVRNMAIAAAELVQDAIADGLLDSPPPARRITAQQAIDGTAAGFYGHGETNPGTRYDPGQHFDWDLFLATYAAAISGTITPQGTTTHEEIDMAAEQNILARLQEIVGWQDTQFQEIRDTAERNRNALAGFVRDVVAAGGEITAAEIDAKFAALTAASEPTGPLLYKGKDSPDVFAWDAAEGLRHIGIEEYIALTVAGANLRELDQAIIDALPRA